MPSGSGPAAFAQDSMHPGPVVTQLPVDIEI